VLQDADDKVVERSIRVHVESIVGEKVSV
jgi:hypothetical protein